MKRWAWITTLALVMAMLLAACGGSKDAAGVVSDLEKLSGKLDSYHAEGTMLVNTGQQPQEYGVSVCFQNPHYYRIALTNKEKDITQIVLRNDDGVFVLTPHLNKSFRFQSDWPKNQGQAYLYETLVQSIVNDEDRQFAVDGDSYVFDVMANYQNASLVRQKVWLNQKNYAPKKVVVTDGDANEMLSVQFTSFTFDQKFEKDYFDMQRNMDSASIATMPVFADDHDHAGGVMSHTSDDADTAAAVQEQASKSFGIIYPSYLPEGVAEKSVSETKVGEDKGVLLRYTGEYSFAIIESPAQNEQTVSSMFGTVVDVDLGPTVGVLIGEQMKTLLWTYDGVDYRLMAGGMPYAEMVKVAQSTIDQPGK
nr:MULTISPECIES: outer membrane lipoprotein-sorting protein [unclassified Paenibacillus]